MSENKIEISVKDILEIIEQLKDLEKELEFERKSKNLFIDDLYKVCEMSLKLETQLQQKENTIKKVREYIENNDLYEQDYDYDYEENLVVGPPSDETARKILLEILDKEVN